jgi:hypothetical protein
MYRTQYITSADTANLVVDAILTGYTGIVGFDTETYHKRINTNPIDVVQVYVPWEDGSVCYVFHVAMFDVDREVRREQDQKTGRERDQRVGRDADQKHKLCKLFTSKKIMKACSAPENDMKWIHRKFGVQLLGTIDIQALACQHGEKDVGLDKLATKYLQHWKKKEKSVALGDWHLKLSPELLEYAANDAYASYELAMRFVPSVLGTFPVVELRHTEDVLYSKLVSSFANESVTTAQILSVLTAGDVDFGTDHVGAIQRACRKMVKMWSESNKITCVGIERWAFVST